MEMKVMPINGINLAFVDEGSGPAVVLCHGFPGLAYYWRHQVRALAEAGYRVIAPDMRGYGRSDAPAEVEEYNRATTVGDMTGLLDALGIDKAVFVGQDFGANMTWDLPHWIPERVAGIAVLGVPFQPYPEERPSESFAKMAKNHFMHMHYFQEHGPADRELNGAPREFMRKILWALSDGDRWLTNFQHPAEGNGYLDVLPEAPPVPEWLDAGEFDFIVGEFERTGFTGGLNWYRAMDLVWEENARFADRRIEVPTAFMTGNREPVVKLFGAESLEGMRESIPDLRALEIVEDAGHFIMMEKPDEVNAFLTRFLAGVTY